MDAFLGQFILLFTVIDPVGSVPVFIAACAGVDAATRRAIALRSCLIAAGIFVGFVVLGQIVFEAAGIDLSAFRIAGSVILFLFALDMIFGSSKPESEIKDAEKARGRALDLAVFPMAIPSIAGPGAIVAMVVLTDNTQKTLASQAITTLLMLVVIGIVYVCLLLADRIQRLIGDIGASIVSRVMGLIMAAIAAEGVLSGIRDYYGIASPAA